MQTSLSYSHSLPSTGSLEPQKLSCESSGFSSETGLKPRTWCTSCLWGFQEPSSAEVPGDVHMLGTNLIQRRLQPVPTLGCGLPVLTSHIDNDSDGCSKSSICRTLGHFHVPRSNSHLRNLISICNNPLNRCHYLFLSYRLRSWGMKKEGEWLPKSPI